MRLLVVGAGSTGGYFGARLAQAGRDVTFLVRPSRAAQLQQSGLRISSPHGDVTLDPKLVTAQTIDAPYDVVLLTVKGYTLDAALDDMAPAVGPDTMILPVLNGMRHLDSIAARFAPRNVIGCALKVVTTLEDDGRIVQMTPLQELIYGELDGTTSPRIRSLDEFMRAAAIGARLSNTIRREMWEKWVLLAALGATTCLAGGVIGEIEACPGGAAFASDLLDEVVEVIRAVGDAPSDAFVETTRAQLTAKGSGYASSMFRDLQRGRPVEVEAIVGDLVRRAAAAGIATPLLSAAYIRLRLYQNKLA